MRLSRRILAISLLAIASSLLITWTVPEAHAANYSLTVTPSRIQESNIPGVVLAINVTGAIIGATYKFTWQVTDPSGALHQASNQTGGGGALSSTIVLSVSYPAQFGTNINYVGNYTINVQQNNPTSIPSVATGRIQVGLTDRVAYQRTFSVSIKARGYGNNSPVTVNISHAGVPASGYPSTVTADSTGSLLTSWPIPTNVSTGLWIVSLAGSPVKSVADSQVFTVYPTNVTIAQLILSQSTLLRSQTQSFTFVANYLNGQASQTGSAGVRITEPDGTTSFSTIATYDTALGVYGVTYQIPISAQTGAWVATIDPDGFDDGNGNGGPLTSVVRGFTVKPAPVAVSASIPSETYTVGEVIPIYATATFPDSSSFTNGTAVATLSSASGIEIGPPIFLTFVQGQSQWVGTYTVNSTDPSGVWLVTVRVADTFGNTGQETISAIVSVPPPSPPIAQQTLPLFYFLLAALAAGSGGSGLLLLRKFNTRQESFDEFFKLTGGQLPPATTLLVIGDPGTGVSTLGLELIYRQLAHEENCGLLAYDAFPSEIEKSMQNMGHDVSSYLKNESFQILDCYSGLAGTENAPIRDPVDFTEVSIQVSSMMEKSKGRPFTLLLDSITPIFNSASANTAINFLRVLAAKVKSNQGVLILTGARKTNPDEVRSKLENVVDGVIELGLYRSGESLVRALTVKRLAGRRVSPIPAEFDIIAGKGIVFQKRRISIRTSSFKREANSGP